MKTAVFDGFVCMDAPGLSFGFVVFRQAPHELSQMVSSVWGFELSDAGRDQARGAMVRRIAQLQADEASRLGRRLPRAPARSAAF